MSYHRRINGFQLPRGCPPDFTQQVNQVVARHNSCVDDYLRLQGSFRQLQKVSKETEDQLTLLQIKFERLEQSPNELETKLSVLQAKYNKLEEAGLALAEKYEQLIAEEETDDKENLEESKPTD